jgi:hypothetical protein
MLQSSLISISNEGETPSSILVNVVGTVSYSSAAPRSFDQTFILAQVHILHTSFIQYLYLFYIQFDINNLMSTGIRANKTLFRIE